CSKCFDDDAGKSGMAVCSTASVLVRTKPPRYFARGIFPDHPTSYLLRREKSAVTPCLLRLTPLSIPPRKPRCFPAAGRPPFARSRWSSRVCPDGLLSRRQGLVSHYLYNELSRERGFA